MLASARRVPLAELPLGRHGLDPAPDGLSHGAQNSRRRHPPQPWTQPISGACRSPGQSSRAAASPLRACRHEQPPRTVDRPDDGGTTNQRAPVPSLRLLSYRASTSGQYCRHSTHTPVHHRLQRTGRLIQLTRVITMMPWAPTPQGIKMLKETAEFIDDEALSRGAAIAFYTVTSIAPARHNQVRPRSAPAFPSTHGKLD